MTQILKQILAKFGRDSQLLKLQEEAIELALALNQINCVTKDRQEMEENLYGELADMKIMMAQAEIIFDKEKIDGYVQAKLERFTKKYL